MGDSIIALSLTVNGRVESFEVEPRLMLVDFLQKRLGLGGTRISCDEGVCGACTVLIDGAPVASCSTFAFMANGSIVETIEGLQSESGAIHPIQSAFLECGALQCGYCTPGMVLLTKALLAENPSPSREEIRSWLSANICRCTGYEPIFEAVERASGKPK